MKDIKWAVLGIGVIANEMAVALKKNGRNIYAVGNRTYDKAVAFAEKYGIGKVYSDYNEMFTDPEVDVIYITPPPHTPTRPPPSRFTLFRSIVSRLIGLGKSVYSFIICIFVHDSNLFFGRFRSSASRIRNIRYGNKVTSVVINFGFSVWHNITLLLRHDKDR